MSEYYRMLDEWIAVKTDLERLKKREADLRKKLFDGAFPAPIEGVNTVELSDGSIVKGTYKINRTVDEAALQAVKENLPAEKSARLVIFKPQLSLTEYRKLTDEERKIFDAALIVRPGSVSLEVIRGGN